MEVSVGCVEGEKGRLDILLPFETSRWASSGTLVREREAVVAKARPSELAQVQASVVPRNERPAVVDYHLLGLAKALEVPL